MFETKIPKRMSDELSLEKFRKKQISDSQKEFNTEMFCRLNSAFEGDLQALANSRILEFGCEEKTILALDFLIRSSKISEAVAFSYDCDRVSSLYKKSHFVKICCIDPWSVFQPDKLKKLYPQLCFQFDMAIVSGAYDEAVQFLLNFSKNISIPKMVMGFCKTKPGFPMSFDALAQVSTIV